MGRLDPTNTATRCCHDDGLCLLLRQTWPPAVVIFTAAEEILMTTDACVSGFHTAVLGDPVV